VEDSIEKAIFELEKSHELKVLMELGYMMHFAEKIKSKRLIGCYQIARIENILK